MRILKHLYCAHDLALQVQLLDERMAGVAMGVQYTNQAILLLWQTCKVLSIPTVCIALPWLAG